MNLDNVVQAINAASDYKKFVIFGRETIASIASSIGFTKGKYPIAPDMKAYALIQPVGGDCRFTEDGTTPTGDIGLRLTEDSTIEIWGKDSLEMFRCIDDTGTAKLEVVYYVEA